MSFPRAPPSLLDAAPATSPGRSAPRGPILDPESRDKRQKAAEVLETWDLQAMHALNSGETIAEVKLRMMKAMVETTIQTPPPATSTTITKGKSKS